MDQRTTTVDVSGKIEEIKQFMPETYKSIQQRAVTMGRLAYELVRRGLRGEVNCFYAFEGGRVVGMPFNVASINADAALYMVEFGCAHVCIWAEAGKDANGPH